LKPVFRPWHLDKAGHNRIRRFGFQLVPDFSGTAHSYVGYTLKAALADCLSWDTTPTRDHTLRSYCTMSRTCTAKTLLVMQPFAPMLFRQGELPGPHLMMEFWHGRLAAKDVQAAWKSAEAAQELTNKRLEDVLWPCGICKKELGFSHYGVSPKGDKRFLNDYWRRVMLPGEWRVCMQCKGTLRMQCNETCTTYECKACHEERSEEHFDVERLKLWLKNRNYAQIVCLECAAATGNSWWEKRANKTTYVCSDCKRALPRSAYGSMGEAAACRCRECERAEVVEQKKLDRKTFKCMGPCQRQGLTHHEFTSAMLLCRDLRWWLCKDCQFPTCERCHLPSEEPVPFGPEAKKELAKAKKYERHWICQWCLYPPCAGCGRKRTRVYKTEKVRFQVWFCQHCWALPVEKTEQQHPPCGGCGAKKPTSLQRAAHAQRPWRCGGCWRKADT
jgi:hypothetical protein